MKISVDKILFHWYQKVPKNFKYASMQLNLLWSFAKEISFIFDFEKCYSSVYIVDLNFLRLIRFHFYKTRECDHAGTFLNIQLFGLDFDFEYKDVRHWDEEKEDWESN